MNKARLEAFSDGVLAIIITIMVLEIKVPHTTDWEELKPLLPVFLSYVMSFLLVGIYWGNHHNLMHCAKQINSSILLSNLHLLFWLSLVPVATGWMGENHFHTKTLVVYGILLMICGQAYSILQNMILKSIPQNNELLIAIKKQNSKVLFSLVSDILGIVFAFINPVVSGMFFVLQSVVWLVPDKNIERAFKKHERRKQTSPGANKNILLTNGGFHGTGIGDAPFNSSKNGIAPDLMATSPYNYVMAARYYSCLLGT